MGFVPYLGFLMSTVLLYSYDLKSLWRDHGLTTQEFQRIDYDLKSLKGNLGCTVQDCKLQLQYDCWNKEHFWFGGGSGVPKDLISTLRRSFLSLINDLLIVLTSGIRFWRPQDLKTWFLMSFAPKTNFCWPRLGAPAAPLDLAGL